MLTSKIVGKRRKIRKGKTFDKIWKVGIKNEETTLVAHLTVKWKYKPFARAK